MHKNTRSAQVEQRERHGPSGPSSAHQQDRLSVDAAGRLLEAAPETCSVGVVSLGAAVAIDGHRVHRADQAGLHRQLIEQRQHGLLARIGDVDAGESRHARGEQEVVEPAPGKLGSV